MSERLDRIESILERMTERSEVQQLQLDVVIEQTLELQAGQRALQEEQKQLQYMLESLAKSVQAHCDDSRRHQ
ncbi:MAG: hypothetical protein WA902_07600 [Thermosynechococcaceae cyanobacterium]